MSNENLLNKLKEVLYHGFIPEAILNLEVNGLELSAQFNIFSVRTKLIDKRLLDRFDQIVNKNPNLWFMFNIEGGKSGENNVFKFISLTTVSVERSFSFLRRLLSDQRKSINSNRIFNYLAANMNK